MRYSGKQKGRIEKAYVHLLPDLKKAKKRLSSIIAQAASRIEDESLVRVRVRKTRIKEFDSILRKAERKGYSEEEVLCRIQDLVGIRVVCNNVDDVYRFKQLLEEHLSERDIIAREDFIKKPQPSGYRAVHLNIGIDIRIGESLFLHHRIPCEIQIRTLLQDSWAELTQDDLYKAEADLPEDLKGRMEDFATHLASADEIAQKVRQRIAREFRVGGPVNLNRVTREGIAYIFQEAFGRSPSDYAVREAERFCRKSGLESLHKLDEVMRNQEFRERVRNAYLKATGFGFSPSFGVVFLAATRAAAQDEKAAFRFIRTWAREEREGIETTWRNEVLAEMPEFVEEFVEEAQAGGLNLEQIAEALGATDRCAYCGDLIVSLDALSEAIADRYSMDDSSAISSALHWLDISWADEGHPELCAYHGHVVDEDD